ncbi:hypothetical protein Tco_0575764 [Tanacetum coccineum]
MQVVLCKGNATGTRANRNMRTSTASQTKNSEWFKEKMLLAQALESGMILDEEQLAFLVDPRDRVDSGLYTQTLPTTAIFYTDDLDAFDSDCDEAPSTSVVLMAKLYAYDLDVLSKFVCCGNGNGVIVDGVFLWFGFGMDTELHRRSRSRGRSKSRGRSRSRRLESESEFVNHG